MFRIKDEAKLGDCNPLNSSVSRDTKYAAMRFAQFSSLFQKSIPFAAL